MTKLVHSAWLPDREEYLVRDIAESLPFAGGPTVQFKKFRRAFAEFGGFRHAVDIGANIGLWSRVMARCFAQVTAFEPNPECWEAFHLNTAIDRDRVTLLPYALGAESGHAHLKTDLKSTGFVRIDADGGCPVDMRSLDSFDLQEVDFVKIDTEGFEHNVVKGAIETIKRCRPVMIVEQKADNAERHGLKRYGAVNLLQKLGMRQVADLASDIIMAW